MQAAAILLLTMMRRGSEKAHRSAGARTLQGPAAALAGPKTPQQREVVRLAPSYRTGRHYGAFMTIFVIALAYAVTAPLILPIAAAYFLTGWVVWRYCQLCALVALPLPAEQPGG